MKLYRVLINDCSLNGGTAEYFTSLKNAKKLANDTDGKLERVIFQGDARALMAAALSANGDASMFIVDEKEILLSPLVHHHDSAGKDGEE